MVAYSQHISEHKRPQHFIQVDSTVVTRAVISQMNQGSSGCVIVAEQGSLVGIFVYRDVVKAVAAEVALDTVPIGALMTHPVITLTEAEATNSEFIRQQFDQHLVSHLPVVNPHGQVIQVLTPACLTQRMLLSPPVTTSLTVDAHPVPDPTLAIAQPIQELERQVQALTAQLELAYEFEATLQHITDRVRDSLDEDQIIQSTVRALAQGLGVDCCNAALFDRDQGTSIVRYEYTASSDILAYKGRISHMADFPELYDQLLLGWHFQFCSLVPNPKRGQVAMLTCPIQDEKGVLGDLWLVNQSHYSFSEPDIRLVRLVANQCAIALRQARLYQEAQAQVQELERLNQLKDDFLSTVSHELRTPMASIKMATQMLEVALQRGSYAVPPPAAAPSGSSTDSHPGHLTPQAIAAANLTGDKVDRYLQILRHECQRETNLINDLLDLARIDAGSIPLSPIPIILNPWLTQISTSFVDRTRTQQQILVLDLAPDLPTLTTDISCLERILTELLQNACKYTPAGERITLGAKTSQQTISVITKPTDHTPTTRQKTAHGDELTEEPGTSSPVVTPPPVSSLPPASLLISVTNSGVEIPASERDRVFDKFYRIPNGDPWKHGGTGLGLTLVKKLAERLQGKIWLDHVGGQTSFILQIPITLSAPLLLPKNE
jgi:signal transduction histidine kinase/CBS domain-containing protein